MAYIDVKIRIFERRGEVYPVEVVLDGEQEFRGALAANVLPWTASGDCIRDGQALFSALFADAALRDAWAVARQSRDGCRVRLVLDTPELHTIPWEWLRDGLSEMVSATATMPFSRYLPVAKPWGQPIPARPLRVLAVLANPDDLEDYNLTPLDVSTERAALQEAFSGAGVMDLQLDFLDAPVTLARVEAALQKGYHILHYVGHGTFSARRQQAALYMQDDDGLTYVVREDAWTGMLARQGVQPHLVMLMTCQSATRSTVNAFRGLGPGLVKVGVPAVVAMQDILTLPSARLFSQTFYRHLSQHGEVDVAMNAARSALLTGDRPDAGTPVLFMRLPEGQLWEEADFEALPSTTDSETEVPDLEELRWFLAEVRDDIAGIESEVTQSDALAQLVSLEMAIMDMPPDLDALADAYAWFIEHYESLAGKVLNYVILHPSTQALMDLAGTEIATKHRRRFIEDVVYK